MEMREATQGARGRGERQEEGAVGGTGMRTGGGQGESVRRTEEQPKN